MAMDEAEKERIRREFEASRKQGAEAQAQQQAAAASAPAAEPLADGVTIKHVVGVVSGKGGVGKSLVTGILATELSRRGAKVGILDADVTGPSIPKMFGLSGAHAYAQDNLLVPLESAGGIKVMSANLVLENETDPVLWRGPVVAGAIKQFWGQTAWGDLDFLLVDMPPGTSDVALTVFQSLPVEGVVIVSSPQDLVQMVVGKAVNMANMMDVPVIGLVENMAYVTCPDCGKKIYPYGPSRLAETAAAFDLIELGQLGIDPALAEACDKGEFESALPAGTLPQMTETVVQVAKFTEFLAREGE
nr:Mrp/NBP35 family ATP-binding protein [Paratractidigestivibacter sp.]